MLPDWPVPKGELQRAFMRALAHELRQRNFTRDIVASPVFEGHGTAMTRADGSYEERDFDSASAVSSIPMDAIKTESISEMYDRMGPIVDSLAKTQSAHVFKVMEEGIRSVGNEIDGGGQPITAELILTAFDRVLIDFDKGRPVWPTIVIHPAAQASAAAELARIETDPALNQRFIAILEKKKAEYLAREADRILAG